VASGIRDLAGCRSLDGEGASPRSSGSEGQASLGSPVTICAFDCTRV
jgi:hypothetical protein